MSESLGRAGPPIGGRGASAPAARRARSPLQLATLLLAYLLLAWQGGVVQSHVHFGAAVADAAPQVERPSSRHDPADCALCRELAQAGQLVASGAPALLAPTPGLYRAAPASLASWTRQVRSHAWQSRGPPGGRTTPPPV